jgi:hypothetical protein
MESRRGAVAAVIITASFGIAVGCANAAAGAPAGDAASALSALDALYQPIVKMPAGPARAQRACGDVDKLKTGAKTVPSKAPATSPLDPATWQDNVETLGYTIDGLGQTCKAPGMKRKDAGGLMHSVDDDIAAVQRWIDELKEDTKARTLTPAMKTFDAPLRRAAADKKRKHVCKEMELLAKAANPLETAPAGVDKAKWGEAYQKLSQSLPDAKNFCDPKSDDNANFDGAFGNVHDSFYAMVLLLPASKN